jgi:2-iminobutanoate/2-iminopropanoate deaminase
MGVRLGNLVFSSGVMGRDPADGSLPDDAGRQTELMFQNLRTLLEQAGCTLDDVAHMRVYVKDDAYREHLNREWLRAFPEEHDRPARHTQLWNLPGGMLIQCEVVAVITG